MTLRWHHNMTTEEQAALMAEIERLDRCYAEAAEFDAAHAEPLPPDFDPDECDYFDPRRDGWVGRNGIP